MERLASEIPKLRGLISVRGAELNYPRIPLKTGELELTREEAEKLRRLGYRVDWACAAACGFGHFEVAHLDSKIRYVIHPCSCHPHSYFLVLEPEE